MSFQAGAKSRKWTAFACLRALYFLPYYAIFLWGITIFILISTTSIQSIAIIHTIYHLFVFVWPLLHSYHSVNELPPKSAPASELILFLQNACPWDRCWRPDPSDLSLLSQTDYLFINTEYAIYATTRTKVTIAKTQLSDNISHTISFILAIHVVLQMILVAFNRMDGFPPTPAWWIGMTFLTIIWHMVTWCTMGNTGVLLRVAGVATRLRRSLEDIDTLGSAELGNNTAIVAFVKKMVEEKENRSCFRELLDCVSSWSMEDLKKWKKDECFVGALEEQLREKHQACLDGAAFSTASFSMAECQCGLVQWRREREGVERAKKKAEYLVDFSQ